MKRGSQAGYKHVRGRVRVQRKDVIVDEDVDVDEVDETWLRRGSRESTNTRSFCRWLFLGYTEPKSETILFRNC
jgi:hypothetical protein